MGSGKLKNKSQNETINSRQKTLKPHKLDHIKISAVDNLKGISEKASESLTTFFNFKENEKVKETMNHTNEDERRAYRPLIQSQKTHVVDNLKSPLKKSIQLVESARNFDPSDRQV